MKHYNLYLHVLICFFKIFFSNMDDDLVAVREMLNGLSTYQSFITSPGVVEYWQPRPTNIWDPTYATAPSSIHVQPAFPDVLDELSGELDEEVGHELDHEHDDEPPNEASRRGMEFHERRLYDHYYKFSDNHFKTIFRMVPKTFDSLLEEIEPHLRSPGILVTRL